MIKALLNASVIKIKQKSQLKSRISKSTPVSVRHRRDRDSVSLLILKYPKLCKEKLNTHKKLFTKRYYQSREMKAKTRPETRAFFFVCLCLN